MYKEKLNAFANQESLVGKAWQHAAAIDLIETSDIKDCSMHCFHYQQMFEMLLKFLLETKSKYGAYPHTHKLNKLLEQLIELTDFRTDKNKYFMALQVITVCAEEYRYNFLLDCEGYKVSVSVADELLEQLVNWGGLCNETK
jgi:HEPN domain-containing protein